MQPIQQDRDGTKSGDVCPPGMMQLTHAVPENFIMVMVLSEHQNCLQECIVLWVCSGTFDKAEMDHGRGSWTVFVGALQSSRLEFVIVVIGHVER